MAGGDKADVDILQPDGCAALHCLLAVVSAIRVSVRRLGKFMASQGLDMDGVDIMILGGSTRMHIYVLPLDTKRINMFCTRSFR